MKIEIDGKLDDRAWQDSEKIFLRPFVKDGAPQLKAVKTAVRAAKDEENLYFSFDCEEPSMRDIVSAKRDYDDREIWHDSSVEIFLNPSGDRKKYYQILLNVSGSVADLYCKPVGGGRTSDWKWNSGTVSAVRQNSNSWTAEIVIPIKSLEGFNREGFPVNFNRNRILLSKDRDYAVLFTWSPFLRHGFHELEHFGSMTFKAEANDNLIQNGDFTEPVKDRFFGSWSAPDKRDLKPGEAWAITSDSFIKGGQSLTLNRKTAEGKIGVTQYLPKMEPDTEYLLTFFIRTENLVPLPGGKSGGACVNIYDDTNRWFPKNFYTGNMPWTKQGFQFRTNSATNHGKPSYIRLWLMNASGAVWFDDVRLRKLPEASR
jgi:hypothetical protein